MRLPVLLLCLTLCLHLGDATHWAYGTALWKRIAGDSANPRTFAFNLSLAFRRNYPSFTPLPTAPPYGPTNGPFAPAGSTPALVCFFTCTATACPGGVQDGQCLGIVMVPRDIIPLGNWFTGLVTFTRALAATTVNSYWDYTNCCRLSTILDTNNDLNWRIRGVLNRYATDSPATTSVPRDFEDIGYLVKYSLLASHPGGRPFRFSLAPSADSSINRPTPSLSLTCTAVTAVCIETSSTMTINAQTGVVTWSSNTIGLYSVQFTITETTLYPGESATNWQPTTIPLDMIFEITPVQPAPYFYAPFPLSVPPQNRIITFYRGVEGQYPVCARSNATGAVIDINPVNLPTGSSWTFLSRGTDAQGAYTCYLVKWAPRVDSVPTVACFLAVDTVNGYSSRGSYCIIMDLGSADCIYVNGIIRDFHIVHADYALPKTGTPGPNYSLDSGLAMLSPILPQDRKPTLIVASNPQSTRAQGIYSTAIVDPMKVPAGSTGEGYYDWWWTDTRPLADVSLRNKQRVETTILCNAGTPSADIFRFLSSSYYPIDNQLFGNEGDPHNRYFTYEINTYLTFTPGHVYTFMSSDDLHVYIEGALPANPGGAEPLGWRLSGIRANFTSVSVSVNMDRFKQVQNPTLVANETYRADIFYAHRNRIGDPGLQIDLPNYKLCNGLTTGVTAFNFTSFNLGNRNNILLQGAASWPASGTYLQLINTGAASQAGAAWYAVNNAAAKVKALYGFRTTFDFQFLSTPNPAEGFAFVIQGGSGAPVPGTQGPNLGYGSLARSIAVEFDSDLTSALGDAARTGPGWTGQFSEVSIHANMVPDAFGVYPGNSATENASPPSLGKSLNDPWMNFLNGSTHSIVIEYQTGQLDPSGAPSPSVIRVFMNKVISPVAQAIVNAPTVSQMMVGGAVYVGFTASNSATKVAQIAINRWDMVVVPISPTKTAPVSPPGSPQNLIAGDNGVFLIQTKDECGNNILIGGEAANINGTYWNPFCPGAPYFSASPVVDNNDGTYGLPYNPTKAWAYQFDVRFTGIPIFYNPFSFVVFPGATDPPSCRIIFGEITAGYSATSLANGMVVAVFTQYGKLRTGPLVYDFVQSPFRAGYTGGPAEFAAFLQGATIQTGDYVAIALDGQVTVSASFTSLPAVLTAMTSLGATLWPPTALQAYSFIGIKGSPTPKCAETKALGETASTCRGSDNRSQSGARPFTISAASLLTPCGGSAGGYGRVNSVFDTPRVPAGSLNSFSVMAVDIYGNLKTILADSFDALFVPDFTQDALPGGGTVGAGSDPSVLFDKGFYILNMNSRRSNTYALYIKHQGVTPTGGSQYGMTVIVVPGPAYLNTSSVLGGTSLTGNGVTTATAGQIATFYINLKDINGNDILSDEPINTISGQLIVKQTGLPPVAPYQPILFNLTWVNDTANNCAYCKLQATYYTTKATVPNVYEYQLQLTINGLTGIFGEPNVVAGPIFYPTCSHDCTNSTLGVLPAGVAVTCTITTRDQWSNVRYVPNAPDPDFTATPNSVFFTQASAILTYTVTYPGAGQYRVTFTPKVKGSVLLNIQSNAGVQIAGSPSTLYIKAGIPAPPSILTIPGQPTIVAGTWYSFTMESRDPYNNVRDGGVAQVDDYILRFAGTIVDGQIRIAAGSNYATTGTYTFEVRQTTPVGQYQVWVRTKFNEHVTNSPFSFITVIPDLTFPNNTIISGPGSTACVAGNMTYILLQARDEYTNLETGPDDLSKYTINIRYPATTGAPITGTISQAGPGLYYANYTCPLLTGQPQYDIVLFHPGQATHVPPYASRTWILPGIILANSGLSYAILRTVADQRAGIINTPVWTIRDCGNLACDTAPVACVTSPCFRVDITNTLGQSVASTDITVAFAQIGANNIPEYSVTFISQYTGTFQVRVYRNTIIETEESKSPGYSINITPGYVDSFKSNVVGVPATVNAGSNNTITVNLRDKYNNPITQTQSVVAIFTGGANVPNVTCVQSLAVQSQYTCDYSLTLSGIWSVEFKSTGCQTGTCNIQGLAPSPDFAITILALGPSCVTSTITTVTSPITAGALVTQGRETAGRFNMLLQDVYGNTPNLNVPFTLSYTFSQNTPATMSANFNAQIVLPVGTGGANYLVSYAPNIAANPSPNVLTVSIDGCPLASGPRNVQVDPSDAVAPPSTIIRPGSPTVAGQPLSFTLQLQDRFGNPWFNAPQRVSATYRGNTPLTVTSIVGQPGQYNVTLPGTSTTRAWEPNYDFVVAVDGNVLDFGGLERNYTVVAGPADPIRTTFGQVSPQVVATVVTYSIYTVDQYGNPCRNSAGTDQIYFSFLLGAVACNEEAVVVQPPPAPIGDYSITAGQAGGPYAVHVGQGVYNITWKGFHTATYSFDLTVNGAPVSCLNEPLQIIRPDVAYPQNSHWYISASEYPDVNAGQTFTIRVILRDQYNNPIETLNAGDVKFGRSIPLAPSPDLTLNDTGFNTNPTTWMTLGDGLTKFPTDVVDFEELRNSAYNFYVTSYTASPLGSRTPVAVFLRYQNAYWLIKGHVGTTTGAPVIDIRVRPGPAATFLPPTIVGTAAYPHNSFTLQAADLYGNIVDTTTHAYSITFVRTGNNAEVVTYSISPTAVPSTIVPGQHVVDFIPYWHGAYQVDIVMSLNDGSGVTYFPGTQLVNITHATCNYEMPATNYRCADRVCKPTYGTCTDLAGDSLTTCGGTMVRCAINNQCVTNAAACPCPAGTIRCGTGNCAPAAQCPVPPAASQCPAGFTSQCTGTGYCRKGPQDCPSPHVCTPGFLMCSDGLTCVRSAAECGTRASCPVGLFQCSSGSCVREFADCPTPKTCTSGSVVCPDGSCHTSRDLCPDVYECIAPGNATSVRCPDGSCRLSLSECPTGVTCPNGYVLCENEACAVSQSACTAATVCPLNRVRCPDGSCRHNMLFCSSQTTCPVGLVVTTTTQVNGAPVVTTETVDLPVKCADGSCKGSATACGAPPVCPYYRCSDGSCVQCLTGTTTCPDRCPTPITCAFDKPLLCLDGSCVSNLGDCSPPSQCAAEAPVRCPDGSCRTKLVDCPSRPVCPSNTPVLCPDGQCGAALDTCAPTELCPSTQIKCPGGFCADSFALCPTLVTCSPDASGVPTIKCLDGTCRASCTGVATNIPSCSPFLTCPQAGAGITCASRLQDCPQSFTCPTGYVRCLDSSCRTTTSLCPAAPTTFTSSKVPCADGTWAGDWSLCPTPISCATTSPYKCWDGTCRMAPADCPVASGCPAGQYQCPTGSCTATPWDQCSTVAQQCSPDTPVRCLADGSCRQFVTDCPDPYVGCPTGQLCSVCPGFLCADGSCRVDQLSCPAPVCPTATPFQCTNGYCAESSTTCLGSNGCPYYASFRCPNDGSCVAASPACASSTLRCPPTTFTVSPTATPPTGFATWALYYATLTFACDDGSCATTASQCYNSVGCPTTSPTRCADGRCVDVPTDCVSGSSGINYCPLLASFRCSDGYCAVSSTQCPSPLVTPSCPPERPIACASGVCVLTASQCPLVIPCNPLTEERCGDGTCRLIGRCSLVNTCPTGSVRCFDGICSAFGCNIVNGCPSYQVRCDNGQCVNSTSDCTSVPPNGCSIPGVPTPYKCADGECVANQTLCRLPNGCRPATPYRCATDGSCVQDPATCQPAPPSCVLCVDGRCVPSQTSCGALNNCPILSPIRCADGSCAKFPAGTNNPQACGTTVVCGPREVLCADGSCQSSVSLCSPQQACAPGQSICPKDWMCHTTAECNAITTSQCPATSPVSCPTGACKKSIEQCGFSGGGPSPPSCSGILCFDGSCKPNIQACMGLQSAISQPGAAFPPTSSVNALCPTSFIMCWDGSCAEACWQCVPIPRCPKGQSRCKDGTCGTEANCQTINAAIAACNTGLVRCEDGMCRESCCHYDGCGFDAPFYCLNRECAKRSQDCDNIAKGKITYFTRRLLQTGNDPTKPCYDNCYAELKSANQRVTVNINRATQITLAIDSSLTPIMRLSIPQGTLVPRTAGSATTVLDLRTVGESRMRSAFNTVHPTRVGDAPYNYIQFLTFPQSVVSPAFECNVDPSIREPFNVNMTVSSLVDNVRRDNSDVWVEDVCLAYLLEIGQYKNWVCLFSSQYDRRLICPPASSAPGCVKGRYIVRDPAVAPPPDNLVSSVFHRCTQAGATSGNVRRGTVYAFIVSPLADYVPIRKKPADIVESNIVPIILGIIFLILFAIFLIYLAVRLARYRKKYHEERAEADRLKEEVENMTQFGGEAGTKDDQVAMTKNPLAAQLEHLQQAVKEEDIKLQQAEQGLRSQEADIRKDHIDNMRSNRDKMLAELERLKAQLQESQASTAAPSTMEEAPGGAAYNAGYDGQAAAGAGAYGQGEDGAYRAGFDQYQAPRGGGGPKKRDL